jgi:hypothetical protein
MKKPRPSAAAGTGSPPGRTRPGVLHTDAFPRRTEFGNERGRSPGSRQPALAFPAPYGASGISSETCVRHQRRTASHSGGAAPVSHRFPVGPVRLCRHERRHRADRNQVRTAPTTAQQRTPGRPADVLPLRVGAPTTASISAPNSGPSTNTCGARPARPWHRSMGGTDSAATSRPGECANHVRGRRR